MEQLEFYPEDFVMDNKPQTDAELKEYINLKINALRTELLDLIEK